MGKLARLIVQPQDVLYDLLGWFQPKVGRYYLPLNVQVWGGVTWADVPANTLRATHYPVFRKIRVDRIAIRIYGAGGAGAKARIGIYKGKDFYPDALIVDAGEVDATTTGTKELTIDETLDVGEYWLVCNTNDSTIDLRYLFYYVPLWGSDVDIGVWRTGYVISQTYDSLPDPFPTGASEESKSILMALRVAEIF